MHCPLCKSSLVESIFEQVWPIIGLGDYAVHYGICETCGYLGQWPQPSETELANYYAEYSNYTVLDKKFVPPVAAPWDIERALFLAGNVFPDGGSIYDVGCGSGKILYWFKRAGWKTGGCDLSPKAILQADEIYGLKCDVGSYADMLAVQEGLDIVLFWHVIEHVKDPVEALISAARAIQPDGYVLFEVPLAVHGHRLQPGWLSFEHLSYFSLGTIETLLHAAGLEMVDQLITTRRHNYPTVAVLARRGAGVKPVSHFADTKLFVTTYLQQEATFWQGVRDRIAAFDGDYVIWGAGVHTSRLMAECAIEGPGRARAIIDSDQQKWGRKIRGLEVMPFEALDNPADTVFLISTYSGEKAIKQFLADKDIAGDQVITLYQ